MARADSNHTPTTRRAAIRAIAAAAIVPCAVMTAKAAPPADDPAFRAADSFYEATRLHEAACDVSDEAGDAAGQGFCDAAMALARTVPTSPLGAALMRTIVIKDAESSDMLWHPIAFESVIAGLEIMAGGNPDDILPERRRAAAAATQMALPPAVDPIFAVIEAHREAEKVHNAAFDIDADNVEKELHVLVQAEEQVWETHPTTFGGLLAKLSHMRDDVDCFHLDVEHWDHIAESIRRIAGVAQ